MKLKGNHDKNGCNQAKINKYLKSTPPLGCRIHIC